MLFLITALLISVSQQPDSAALYRQLVVDISSQRLFCIAEGSIIDSILVSTCQPSETLFTPRGRFRIVAKLVRVQSARRHGRELANWLGFTPDGYYGIHSFPDSDSAYEKDLGRPVSTGCVRISRRDDRWLFDWAEIGIPILITESWDRRP